MTTGYDYIRTEPASPLPAHSTEVAVYYDSDGKVAPPYTLVVTFQTSGTVVEVVIEEEGIDGAVVLEIPEGDDSGTIADKSGPSDDGGFTIAAP